MYQIHNPDYLNEVMPVSSNSSKVRGPIFVGTLQDLSKLTEEQWEERKKKALRHPEGK